MNTRQKLGIAGSLLLAAGTFTPIISLPFIGNMSYIHNGKGDGIFILIIAAISLALCLLEKYKGLWLTSIAGLAIMAFTFTNLQNKIHEVKSQMDVELAGNPFRGLADIALNSVQLQWGWVILLCGIGLLIAAAAINNTKSN